VPSRIVTLVVDDPRGALPVIEVESPWWMESGPLVEAARLAFGVEVTIVRLLEAGTFPGGPVAYLVECPDVDAALLSPWTGKLLDDQRRAPYARPGGIAALTEWADAALTEQGLTRRGPVEQVRTWNLSCLLRIRTTGDPVVGGPASGDQVLWLKAVPDFFAHESDVMAALADVDPTLVPELVATRPGATLMREVGERDGYEVGPDRHFEAVKRFHTARDRVAPSGLAAVPRFGPAEMTVALASVARRHSHDLAPDEASKLANLTDQVADRWAAGGTKETLVHGDLHGGNLRLAGNGPGMDTIIDWGDASISHPLFDLAVLDSYTPDWAPEATDRWLDLLGCDRTAWSAFRPLAAIRLATVYQRFCDGIEASEQIYHRHDIVPALRIGLGAFDE